MGQSLLTSSGASDCPYNVGDIYITTLNTNPQDIWQNTVWEKIKDKFLLGAGDTYSIGSSGGEATHTLTNAELPNITVAIFDTETTDAEAPYPEGSFKSLVTTRADPSKRYWYGESAFSIGNNNQPHNNMPPYLCVNMWIRTE